MRFRSIASHLGARFRSVINAHTFGQFRMADWQNVVRVLHLLGGLRVINNPGPQAHVLPVWQNRPNTFEFPAYPDLIRQTQGLGFVVLGCDFIDDEEHLKGLREVDWRPLMQPIGAMAWPTFAVQQVWSNIGHAAAEKNRMSIFEKARHIATQIRICEWRLRDLSESYHTHLRAVCGSGDFKAGLRFSGRYSQHLFVSGHAMFAELASLRDHLAMFIAREILGITRSGIDSWPRLLEEKSFKNSNHALTHALRSENEWLLLFGEYRNLFLHNAPMSEANGSTMVAHVELDTKIGKFPSVSLPLPKDPGALRDRLRSGEALRSFEHWIEIAKKRDNKGPDTLAYCYEVFAQMITLANEIAKHSPLAPKMLSITNDDIIGDIKVTTRIIPPLAVRLPPSRQN